MQRIEFVYLHPVTVDTSGPFDSRIDPSADAAAGTGPGAPPDAQTLSRALQTDPPRLLAPKSQPIVIKGHRKIQHARMLDFEAIPCMIYPSDTPAETVAAIALAGEPARLSGVEKIIAMAKTITYATQGLKPAPPTLEREFPDWLYPLLDRFAGRRISQRFAARLSQTLTWPAEDLHSLHASSLSIDQIASLIDLTAAERRAVLRIRAAVPLTTGEQKTLARLLVLARGRKHFDLDAWLARAFADPATPPAGDDVVKSLRAATHPRLTHAEETITGEIGRMALPNRLRITPPENLEGGSFSCYFRFSTDRELTQHVAKLEKIIDDGSAKKIIRMLEQQDEDDDR